MDAVFCLGLVREKPRLEMHVGKAGDTDIHSVPSVSYVSVRRLYSTLMVSFSLHNDPVHHLHYSYFIYELLNCGEQDQ